MILALLCSLWWFIPLLGTRMSVNIESAVCTLPVLTSCQFRRSAHKMWFHAKSRNNKGTAHRRILLDTKSGFCLTQNHNNHSTTTTAINGNFQTNQTQLSRNPIKRWLQQSTTNLGQLAGDFSPAFESTEEDLLVAPDELRWWHWLARYKYVVVQTCLILIHCISFKLLYANKLGDSFFPPPV